MSLGIAVILYVLELESASLYQHIWLRWQNYLLIIVRFMMSLGSFLKWSTSEHLIIRLNAFQRSSGEACLKFCHPMTANVKGNLLLTNLGAVLKNQSSNYFLEEHPGCVSISARPSFPDLLRWEVITFLYLFYVSYICVWNCYKVTPSWNIVWVRQDLNCSLNTLR